MAAKCGLFGPQLELEKESNRTQQKRKQRRKTKEIIVQADNDKVGINQKKNQKQPSSNSSPDISATWHVTLEPSRSDPHNFAYNHNSAHISNVVGRIQESRQQGEQLGDGKRC